MLIATLLFSIWTVQSPKLPINFNPTNKQLGDYIIISEPSSVTLHTELRGDNHNVGSVQQAAAVTNAKYWTRVVCGVGAGSISLLELVMPFVEVDVEHDHRARGQTRHQKPGQRVLVDWQKWEEKIFSRDQKYFKTIKF